jgi:predicted dienelactone hydrolase
MSKTRLGRRIFRVFGVLALLGVLGLGVLFGSLWLEHRTETTLPAPTGPLAVGRATFDWSDDTHPDTLAPAPGAKRELFVWIWYPAAAAQSAVLMDDYLPSQWRAEFERNRGALISNFLTRDLAKVHAHSVRNAEVSPRERSFPVVMMRTGASSEVANYSTLAEDLASHGYVVVGFDAPHRTNVVVFPDGRVIRRTLENNPEEQPTAQQEVWVNRVLTAWTADMARVGVFGHSFGGAQALQFCHDDSRCKAGIDVDGEPFGSVVQEGLHQPFLFLLSDHGAASDPESRQVLANIQSIYDRLPPDGRLRISIHGANHYLFSDDGALLKSHILMRTLRMFGIVGMDGRRQLAITAYCVHSFFDVYLKGASVSRLKTSSALYPEIRILE